jgi:hypothetical protein
VNEKLPNDSTSSVKGFLYQFYKAVEYCFELKPHENLYIEKYGDISISGIKAIEVKNYSKPLTDSHDNFWQTLHNWCNPNFDHTLYKKLILLTTQQIGTDSRFKGWNDKKVENKIKTVKNIAVEYKQTAKSSSKTVKSKVNLMNDIVDENIREKLSSILDKFCIIDCEPGFQETFESLKCRYARHIPDGNQEQYLEALLGFVINPATVNSNWEISCETFSGKVQALSELYCTQTKIFPKINETFSSDQNDNIDKSLFIKKIDDIQYDNVKPDAINDFLATNYLLTNDFKKYKLIPSVINNYEDNLLASYKNKRNTCERKVEDETDLKKIMNESKNFYDEVIGSPVENFLQFIDTPYKFRNGFYHIIADDDETKIVWKLKGGSEKNDKKI